MAGHKNSEVVRYLAKHQVSRQLVSNTVRRYKELSDLKDRHRSDHPKKSKTSRRLETSSSVKARGQREKLKLGNRSHLGDENIKRKALIKAL